MSAYMPAYMSAYMYMYVTCYTLTCWFDLTFVLFVFSPEEAAVLEEAWPMDGEPRLSSMELLKDTPSISSPPGHMTKNNESNFMYSKGCPFRFITTVVAWPRDGIARG